MFRVMIWATIGFLVAGFWGVYFSRAPIYNEVPPIIYSVARLTQPLAVTLAYYGFSIGVRSAFVINAATYALVGMVIEAIRRQLPSN
jgi:hypothetical protein